MKKKVTKLYKDHEAGFLLAVGIICGIMSVVVGGLVSVAIGGLVGISIGGVVGGSIGVAGGIAVGKKMEHDRLQEILIKNSEYESLIRVDATRVLFFFNRLDKSMGTVGDLLEGDTMTETIRKQPYITDDTEIIGVKYYFKNN